jgi:hypothetical protein
MSLIEVRVTLAAGSLGQLRQWQAKIPGAIARGLNEGGDKVRTQVQHALWRQTGVKRYSSITSRVRTVRAFPGKLSYQIIATGKGMKISEFPLRVTSGPGGGVTANVWGIGHLFQRSFQIAGRAGDSGLRARLGPARKPIRALYGPALPKEIGKAESAATFYATAAAVIPATIMKHLMKAAG